jgi:ribosomal-protein-alanine N-acetyltransferase
VQLQFNPRQSPAYAAAIEISHEPMVIRTSRLDLIPADKPTTRAALEENRDRFGALLDARIPASWPPELLDRPALEWVLRTLDDPAHDSKWGMYWIVLRDDLLGRTLVGTAGFKGAPKDETVEIGYGIVAEHQRRGYATEATRAMLAYAFNLASVHRVIAETLPSLIASIGVLEKCGFRFIGDGSEPGVIRYEVVRT